MIELEKIQGLYDGSVFLICGGPSFEDVDRELLSQSGIVTMAVNNSPRSFRPNLWCAIDPTQRFLPSIYRDPNILKFLPRAYSKKSGSPVIGFTTNLKFDSETFLDELSVNYGSSSGDGGGRSVMLAAIKILYVLGFTKIYLLGVDFKMEKDKANYHFTENTSDWSIKSNNYTYGKLTERFTLLKPELESRGVEVFNCNPNSALSVFPYKSMDDAINEALEGLENLDSETTEGMYVPTKRKKQKPENLPIEIIPSDIIKDVSIWSKKQICLSGMSRSGNHAILNWIASQFNGRVEFRNNVSHTGTAKFIGDPASSGLPKRLWRLPDQPKHISGEPRLFLYSRENESNPTAELLDGIQSSTSTRIVILRDPFNLLASIFEYFNVYKRIWFNEGWVKRDDMIKLFAVKWLEYADSYENNRDITPISYNRWVCDEGYRDDVATSLNVDFRTDKSMLSVPRNGGGSSFDKSKLNGSGVDMKVLTRWNKYKFDKDYVDTLKSNPELLEVSNRIFGEIDGIAEMLNDESELRDLVYSERMTATVGRQNKTSNGGIIEMIDHIDLSGKSMVEIGCHRGVSTSIFALNCEHITTVDKWGIGRERIPQKYPDGSKCLWANIETDARERLSIRDNVSIIKGDGKETADSFDDRSLDFVYIDALHTYVAASGDIEAWLPKIKKGGWIGGHDYVGPANGVKRAVRDLMNSTGYEDLHVFRDTSWALKLEKRECPPINVICVLKSGGDYDKDDVYNLKRHVKNHLTVPYNFVCYSDVDEVADVALDSDLSGWWSKLEIFKDKGPCIFLDLDTALFGSIDTLAHHIGLAEDKMLMLSPFHREWREKGIYASGVMAWNGDFSYVLDEFKSTEGFRGDQDYITAKLKEHEANLDYVNDVLPGIVSYKFHCQKGIKPDTTICCFHGRPRPREVGSPFWEKNNLT
jgi:predicted O-methyltransferase YrrM